MANKKISELVVGATPDGTELAEGVQGGVNKQFTFQQIADLGGGGSTPDASTTVAGKVQQATSAEILAGTDTGSTGAQLFVVPSDMNSRINSAVRSQVSFSDMNMSGL